MRDATYPEGPLTPAEREEYEEDLISVSDRELDMLENIEGLDVLYAGGASLLWLEGLSLRVGRGGTVTALDSDEEKIESVEELLEDADLEAPVRLVSGDVLDPPFALQTFDLVYSAGLFHELDVSKSTASEALASLASLVRPGGRLATSDFVDVAPATQLDDEGLQAELARALSGTISFGIGPPDRLVALHDTFLENVRWRISQPHPIRHLDRLVLAEDEPAVLERLPPETRRELRNKRATLRELIRREGYTRPSTLYAEGSQTQKLTG